MKWLDTAWWHGMETLLALQCPADADGTYRILRLRKDQQRIHVLSAGSYEGQGAMLSALDQYHKLPIVLVLTEAMVMERILPQDAAANPVAAVLGVGIGDSSDFEVMRFPADGNRLAASIIRRETLESNRSRLERHAPRVITAVYSPRVVMYLLSQSLPQSDDANLLLTLGDRKLAFRKGLPCAEQDWGSQNYQEQSSADLAKALGVNESDTWLYASLVFAWLQQAAQEKLMPFAEHWSQFQTISRYRQIAVVSALALFVWFACLASLRLQGERRKEELEYAYSQNLPVLNAIQQLDQKIAARAELGNKLGSQTLRTSKASYYLDRIAAVMPTEMHLLEAIIGPDEEDFKRQGMRDIQPKEIILRGECPTSAPIAQFSESIQKVEGIENLLVERSEMNFQTGMYEFLFLANIAEHNSRTTETPP